MFVLIITSMSFLLSVIGTASAAPGSPVTLGAMLSVAYDGTTPLPAIDPLTNNGDVATVDYVGQTFDVNINSNDGNQHQVRDVKIVATISGPQGAQWINSNVDPRCSPNPAPASLISADGFTLTCVLAGPFDTGTTLNVMNDWSPSPGVPNGTAVDVTFEVSATMEADSNFPSPIDPDNASSNTTTTNVVSQGVGVEVRKWSPDSSQLSGVSRINRDANGDPVSVGIDWGVTLGIQNPTELGAKGVSSTGLGDVALEDNLSSLGAPWQNAVLDSCSPKFLNDGKSSSIPISQHNYSRDTNYGAVKNSGTFICNQTGGPGSDISISGTGTNWDATWFPGGAVNDNPKYFKFNDNGQGSIYNTPAGDHTHAAVATFLLSTTVPWADIVAADQGPTDKNNGAGTVEFCNSVSNLNVSGSNPAFIDSIPDNEACVVVTLGTHGQASKGYAIGANGASIASFLNQPYPSVGPAGWEFQNDPVYPGMKHYIVLNMSNSSTSVNGISNAKMCDAIDTNKMNFTQNDFYDDINLGAGEDITKFVANGYAIGDFASTHANIHSRPLPDGFAQLENTDIVVEYAVAAPMHTAQAMHDVDCDDAGLIWNANPNLLVGGINAANLVRIRIANNKSIPPDYNLSVSVAVQVNSSLSPGTIIPNLAQFTSSLTPGIWNRAYGNSPGGICDPLDTIRAIEAYCDRAVVVPVTGHIEITDNLTEPPPSLVNNHHRQYIEQSNNIQAGNSWTYDVHAEMKYLGHLDIDDVKIYNVLPPGITYQSSTTIPTEIIGDCDIISNSSCVTNPLDRTNFGYTTLVWDRGDHQFDAPIFLSPGVPYLEVNKFGFFRVTTTTSRALFNGQLLQVRGYMEASSGLSLNQAFAFPNNNAQWSGYYDNFSNGQLDDDWIRATQLNQYAISKSVVDKKIPLEGIAKFDVTYGNFSSTAKTFDFIDILPFNGDNRIPPSSFSGDVGLENNIDISRASKTNTVYITNAVPSTIDQDPNSVVAGTGIWQCTMSQVGTPGCPSLSNVSAIRVVTNALDPGETNTIRINLKTTGNTGQDVYTNRAFGRAQGLLLPVQSEDVFAVTPNYSVGNIVFSDINDDGNIDVGEPGIAGVTLYLYSVGADGIIGGGDDQLVDTTVTGSDGRYVLNTGTPGNYYVEISSSDFSNGNVLDGYSLQDDGVANANNNVDENVDHNLLFSSGKYRTGLITLSDDDEPLNEIANVSLVDENENMTIDLGLFPPIYSIGNRVWIDENHNGIQDSGEANVDGTVYPIEIKVFKEGQDPNWGDLPVGSTFIDANGNWSIGSLIEGNYFVHISLPNDLAASYSPDGDPLVNGDDSDFAQGYSDRTNIFTLNEDSSKIDFGVQGVYGVGSHVFYDLNKNGILDDSPSLSEGFLNGVTVILYGPDGDEIDRTVTTNGGQYKFTNLFPGNGYRVRFTDLPDGSTFTTQSSDTTVVGVDSDSDPDANGYTRYFNIDAAGPRELNEVDAGVVGVGDISVGDYIWFDTNENGLQDSLEPALNGSVNQGGVLIADAQYVDFASAYENRVAIMYFDSNGHWQFDNMIPGNYNVFFIVFDPRFDFTQQLNSDSRYSGLDSDVVFDADATAYVGLPSAFTTVELNSTTFDVDAGLIAKQSVGGNVYSDIGKDGVQEAGDDNLAEILVLLKDSSGNEIARSMTDANGNYKFSVLDPGDYTIEFSLDPDWNISPKDVGSNDDIDSDADQTLKSINVSVASGEHTFTYDAGLYISYDISLIKEVKGGKVAELKQGDSVTYTFTIENSGAVETPAPIKLLDVLPQGLDIVGFTAPPQWECTTVDNTLECISLTAIAPNSVETIELVVKVTVDKTQSIINIASITAGLDTPIVSSNNTSDAAIKVDVKGITQTNTGLAQSIKLVSGTLPFTGGNIVTVAWAMMFIALGAMLKRKKATFNNR